MSQAGRSIALCAKAERLTQIERLASGLACHGMPGGDDGARIIRAVLLQMQQCGRCRTEGKSGGIVITATDQPPEAGNDQPHTDPEPDKRGYADQQFKSHSSAGS